MSNLFKKVPQKGDPNEKKNWLISQAMQPADEQYRHGRVICEVCKKNWYDYIARIIYEGTLARIGHPICNECIAEHLVEVLGQYKAFLDCYSLPVLFTTMWDAEEVWVPATRKGPLFPYESA